MRTLIAAAKLTDVVVADGGGKSPALSLAKSIVLSRGAPVGVLVDADTTDEAMVREQRQAFNDLRPSVPSRQDLRLFLAVPTLEAELFPNAETFSQIFRVDLTEGQIRRFKTDPMSVVKSFLSIPGDYSETRIAPGRPMDAKAAKKGFDRPLLKEVLAFLADPLTPERPRPARRKEPED
ncbi:hypothetical protein ASE02_04335 [Phenylobacterium sp. Root700]|nr:hypothetical protein ASE02_04335 [Phenylobacterium sp. Root700]